MCITTGSQTESRQLFFRSIVCGTISCALGSPCSKTNLAKKIKTCAPHNTKNRMLRACVQRPWSIPLRPPPSFDQVNSSLLVWNQSQGWDVTIWYVCYTYRSVEGGASVTNPETFDFRLLWLRLKYLVKCSLITWSIKELGYRKAIWFSKQLRYPRLSI